MVGWLDRLQRRNRRVGFVIAVIYKYVDDQGGYLAALITYYAFVSLFPLLLLLTTALGVVLVGHPDLQQQVLQSTFSQFPVIGNDLVRNVGSPEGRGLAALIGIVLALWAGSHDFESFEHAMRVVWEGPGVAPESLVRSRLRAFVTMAILGGAVLVTTTRSAQ